MRSLLRLLAFFTLLVFSGQTVLPALHHALLAHEVCVEHGHLVHGDGAGGHGHAPTDAPKGQAPSSEGAPEQVQALDDGDHEHCAQCAAFRLHHAAFVDVGAEQTDSGVAGRAAALRLVDVYTQDGLGLHRLAPKQGPPSIG